MKKLFNKLYYVISFIPSRTLNPKMKGNEHYMTNKELYKMRTKQVFKLLTFRNVITYKIYKLKKLSWLKFLFPRQPDIFN